MTIFAQKTSPLFVTAQHTLHINSMYIYKIDRRKGCWGGGGDVDNIILHIVELPHKNIRFHCLLYIV
jgi:hypothetical protein